jgi:hypothetical protein
MEKGGANVQWELTVFNGTPEVDELAVDLGEYIIREYIIQMASATAGDLVLLAAYSLGRALLASIACH